MKEKKNLNRLITGEKIDLIVKSSQETNAQDQTVSLRNCNQMVEEELIPTLPKLFLKKDRKGTPEWLSGLSSCLQLKS